MGLFGHHTDQQEPADQQAVSPAADQPQSIDGVIAPSAGTTPQASGTPTASDDSPVGDYIMTDPAQPDSPSTPAPDEPASEDEPEPVAPTEVTDTPSDSDFSPAYSPHVGAPLISDESVKSVEVSTPAEEPAPEASTDDVPSDEADTVSLAYPDADPEPEASESTEESEPTEENEVSDSADVDMSESADTADTNGLDDIKQQALQQLSPLFDHLDQSPEEKFNTTMMMLQATDDRSLVSKAYEAAQAIPDEKARAQALLDVINEINYFNQKSSS